MYPLAQVKRKLITEFAALKVVGGCSSLTYITFTLCRTSRVWIVFSQKRAEPFQKREHAATPRFNGNPNPGIKRTLECSKFVLKEVSHYLNGCEQVKTHPELAIFPIRHIQKPGVLLMNFAFQILVPPPIL